MSDEVFSTTLAYTKSPKVTKRTTFQDELIKAITARSARQRSSEYSDDFDSDEIVSLGDFSDTSVDENSVKKKMNYFQISDDEEKNSPKLSFLKTKKSNSDITKDKPVFAVKNDEETAPDGCEDMVINALSESQNKDQAIEKEKIKMKLKPRILPVKNTSSENSSSLEADDHFKPSPRPRSMLKKHSLREEKDGPGEDKETALHEESEAHSAPSSLPRLNGRQLEAEKKAFSENLGPEDPSLSSSSLKEGLGDSFSPGSEEKASVKDQKEDLTENHNSLKPSENEENSSLIDFVTPALEKCKENQVTTDDLEEEKEKTELIMNDDLAVDPPLLKSQSVLISSNATESAKKTIEDRNMKNKKSTNNRASSASGRLMTSEFLKKSSSTRKTPSATTSSHYLGTLKVLDQKPSQKQNMEPDRADNIRAAVYQEWLEKKNVYLHEMHRIKRIESENLRIQNEQKRAAKREEALASFEAWKAMKEKEAKKIAAKKKLEEKNKKKTEEENAVRKGEALQAFERWKEKKMEYLKEKNKKEKEYERAKKQKEEETVAEKRKDNLTAVEKWNEKKEALFKEKEKEKINEKRKEELKRAEKKDKDKQAIDEYEKWLEKKERQERIERKQKKHHSFLENEALPPWSPPSRTVFSKAF
ncbi:microtubule-associated protein 9 isoform X2 [Diceros bicornis minor]|uniref:microtubule-associated protein 9 isoform X2 n=1 Tax=Diceros bicornis minor TaxID=77932 RepID=UPI0026EC45A7|nr:microtubule-associated protein 9 isoform X2 [Diceros bicornis minor]